MKIVADENIAGLREFFADSGELVTLPGRTLSARDVQDADVLLVRSVTAVNRALLEHSAVRFVGSCTIGTDHFDLAYLQERRIHWAHAPGCNAPAVVDYVQACLLALDVDISTAVVGIVGCGNVGALLQQRLSNLGVHTLCCDPFLKNSRDITYHSLREILPRCDVLCLHTPLTLDGPHPTRHLIGENELRQMKANALLLNAGRGAVVDNQALLEHLLQQPHFCAVLDVWENEPLPLGPLLERASIATPHIAGYSLAGKWRGTYMIYQSFCNYFSAPPRSGLSLPAGALAEPDDGSTGGIDRRLKEKILAIYDPRQDSAQLKETLTLDDSARALAFDALRKNYLPRKELVFA